ncbi:exported hypothetical protein [Candidatus Zixiibacteriota bacterium]|nr:exported hypothetical protein [candidate division Zixibacteria bacterium]
MLKAISMTLLLVLCAALSWGQCPTCPQAAILDQSTASFGSATAVIGDYNNDGTNDVLVGAYNQFATGHAYILSGATGAVLRTYDGVQNDDWFGYAVANIGDIDNCGKPDFAIGAPAYGTGGYSIGIVYVYSGSSGNQIGSPIYIDDLLTDGQYQLGRSIAAAGDWNNDGNKDIIIGAPGYQYYLMGTGWQYMPGHAFIYSYYSGSWHRLGVITGEYNQDYFGFTVAKAGNVNGDQYDDIIVGTPYNHNSAAEGGKIYVYAGNSTTTIIGTLTGAQSAGHLGQAIAGAGDLNGDGRDDILIGEPGAAKIWAVSMASGTVTLFTKTGVSLSEFGYSISGTQDLNGDDIPDFIVGAPGTSSPTVYVYSGDAIAAGAPVEIAKMYGTSGSRFGQSVSGSLTSSNPSGLELVGAPQETNAYLFKCIYNRSYYVSNSGDDANGNGCQANPYKTIQKGLDVATSGDTVIVVAGTYTGTGNRNLNYHGKAVVLRSASGADQTIIDCQSATRGFIFDNGEGSSSKVIGFSIQNGYGLGQSSGGGWVGGGGGIYIEEASPTIDSCKFISCKDDMNAGGAIIISSGYNNAAPLITRSVFDGNLADVYNDTWFGLGGAIAVYNYNSAPSIDSCIFMNNVAKISGGAIYLAQAPNAQIAKCLFKANQAGDATHTGHGGAIYTDDANTLQRCTFIGNSANEGAVLYAYGWGYVPFTVTFDNNIAAGNLQSEAIRCAGTDCSIVFDCNVFWDNYSNVSGLCDCSVMDANTHFIDPLFCDAVNGNYSISTNSICAPANSPCGQLIGAYTTNCSYSLAAGPTLVSPSDGSSTTSSTPTLDWSDVTGATAYEVWVDNNQNFCSPERVATDLEFSTWVVSPGLGDSWWYWRARAYVNGAWTNWSATWSFQKYTPHGNPSCPVLYSFDGKQYDMENPLLTACELNGYTQPVTDFYHVNFPVASDNGAVEFQLKEMEDEITYLGSFELMTVDHSPSTYVAVSTEGEIISYDKVIVPLSAVDNEGIDRLAEVSYGDGSIFESHDKGFLTLTFPNLGRKGVLGLACVVKPPCPIERKLNADQPEDNKPPIVSVEYLNSSGNWVKATNIPPRENVVQEIVQFDPQQVGNQQIITIRLSWDKNYQTDVIYQLNASNEQPIIKNWEVENAQLSTAKFPIRALTEFSPADPLMMVKGDVAQFTFGCGYIPEGFSRDYIIKASGRYQPDYSVYTNLIPSGLQLYDNYPNPFNPSTQIAYDLPKTMHVKLVIFNALGQEVKVLVDENQTAGHKSIIWDGTNGQGQSVASGIYLYKMVTNNFAQTKKMTLLK